MAEEPKDPTQGESVAARDTATDSPPESALHDGVSAEGEEAAVAPAAGETTSMEPQDETFWEDSVDASAVNLAEDGTPQEKKEEKPVAEDTPVSEEAPPEVREENTAGEATEEATPDETPAEAQSGSLESETSGEDNAPADEEADQPAPEDESPPVMDSNKEIAAENKEDGDEEAAAVTGEKAPAESDVTAEGEKKEAEEGSRELVQETPEDPESPPREETAAQDTSELKESEAEKEEAVSPDDGAAEAENTHWYSSKKGMMIAAGILLLIIASVGYSVAPSLRSGNPPLSTFLRGTPENAYSMKFFLPLDVGYEEARFVKLTIAIELADKGFKNEIDENVSNLRQEVIDLLLTKSPQEVKSAQGKNLLRQEITSRLNNYLPTDCIKDTYFTELVIL